ncbi:hypothetical protein BGX33_008660 [Mortierella sp. NVP41]|nr:hypothetical protein BGX33_008660 [Mortierella sp. NVP41]
MADETRDYPIVFGDGKMTLGDLYDRTPKDMMSKVMLEEKVFKTWYSGRTVLLGDGALASMHDAIALANLIYALPANNTEEIEKTFREYQAERLPPTIESFNGSQMMSKLFSKRLVGMIALFMAKLVPRWLWRRFLQKTVLSRPEFGYLPKVRTRGPVETIPTPSSEKARALYNKRIDVVVV